MTEYWIDVEGCQRVIRELRTIMEDKNEEFQWVDSDLLMVDRYSYCEEESTQNTKNRAEQLDEQYYKFLDEKLTPTYNSAVSELQQCIDSMAEVVDYYVSGDAAMAYDTNAFPGVEFPEFRSGSGSDTSDLETPQTGPDDRRNYTVHPRDPDPDNPLTDEHYTDHPFEYSYNVKERAE
ncbi:hypothetical protein [Citricoccus sp. GCM10030269]|uniref:hypothetical protein n=1 Tax=Citricoccus sp. GCM10030269 TaxID=3273388 RepID=UPI00366B6629